MLASKKIKNSSPSMIVFTGQQRREKGV